MRLIRCLCALLILMGASPALAASPAYERSDCPFDGADAVEGLECGFLTVPESRVGADVPAAGGRTIRLAVAVLRATGPDPAPDPIVFLSGGPGAGAVEGTAGRARSPFWAPLRVRRDLVFFDQRGTGYSEAAFCPEMDQVFNDIIYRGLSVREADAERVRAAKACATTLRAQGVDIGAYNSAASALDLADLRKALRYERWNLFGLSYGTRLALTALRDAPEGIRSVILDSTVPPDIPQWTDAGDRFTRSLRLAFDQCAADPACQAAYPSLEEDTYAVMRSLDADPVVITTPDTTRFRDGRLVLDGALWAQGIFQGFYDHNFLPVFPLAVQESKRRNEAVLRALASGIAFDADAVRWGMNYAVNCYEVASLNPREAMLATQRQHPELAPWFGATLGPYLHDVCAVWHDKRGDAREYLPVESDVPALVLAGEFDPITPPAYGRHVARTLPNATFVEVPAMGHGPSPYTDCSKRLLREFLDAPEAALDTACVDALPPVAFLTDVHLNPGVYRFATALQGGPATLVPLGLAALLLLSAVIGWPLVALVRKLRGRTPGATTSPGSRTATWLAVASSATALLFLVALALAIQRTAAQNFYVLAFGLPRGDAWMLMLPWILVLLAAATLVVSVISWRRSWWSRWRRLHYGAVAAAAAGIAVLTLAWGIIP